MLHDGARWQKKTPHPRDLNSDLPTAPSQVWCIDDSREIGSSFSAGFQSRVGLVAQARQVTEACMARVPHPSRFCLDGDFGFISRRAMHAWANRMAVSLNSFLRCVTVAKPHGRWGQEPWLRLSLRLSLLERLLLLLSAAKDVEYIYGPARLAIVDEVFAGGEAFHAGGDVR